MPGAIKGRWKGKEDLLKGNKAGYRAESLKKKKVSMDIKKISGV